MIVSTEEATELHDVAAAISNDLESLANHVTVRKNSLSSILGLGGFAGVGSNFNRGIELVRIVKNLSLKFAYYIFYVEPIPVP